MANNNNYHISTSLIEAYNMLTDVIHRDDQEHTLEQLQFLQEQLNFHENILRSQIRHVARKNDNAMRRLFVRNREIRSVVNPSEVTHTQVNNSQENRNRRAGVESNAEKTIALSKSKLENTVTCAVCLEAPQVKDCIQTECGHYYCKNCWNGWINSERSNKSCPVCRMKTPKIVSFRGYAPRKRATTREVGTSENINVIDLC